MVKMSGISIYHVSIYQYLTISLLISQFPGLSLCVCNIQLAITFFPYIRFTCGLKLKSNMVSRWGWNCFRGPLPGPEYLFYKTLRALVPENNFFTGEGVQSVFAKCNLKIHKKYIYFSEKNKSLGHFKILTNYA